MKNKISRSGKAWPPVAGSVRGLTSEGMVFVRYYCNTYIARCHVKTATAVACCTMGRREAAEACARKIMGGRKHIIEMCGDESVWQILALIN